MEGRLARSTRHAHACSKRDLVLHLLLWWNFCFGNRAARFRRFQLNKEKTVIGMKFFHLKLKFGDIRRELFLNVKTMPKQEIHSGNGIKFGHI